MTAEYEPVPASRLAGLRSWCAALALIVVPLVFGGLVLFARLPAEERGVYLEWRTGVFAMTGYPEGDRNWAATELTTPVVPEGQKLFFLVVQPVNEAPSEASVCRICFLVAAGPSFQQSSECTPIPTSSRRVSSGVVRVSTDAVRFWGSGGVAVRQFREVIRLSPPGGRTPQVLVRLTTRSSSRQHPWVYTIRIREMGF